MNLAFIRYFLAVAETASFTAAAERCRVTQPTLLVHGRQDQVIPKSAPACSIGPDAPS